jgi:hypothetical protein
MTLYELINKLLDIAGNKPNIRYCGEGDIYELNHINNIEYSAFYITQNDTTVNNGVTTYNLNLFYIDRIVESADNHLLIQSNGIDAICNIINDLVLTEDVEIEGDIVFTPFYQKFKDDCCGVFSKISIITGNNIGICTYE